MVQTYSRVNWSQSYGGRSKFHCLVLVLFSAMLSCSLLDSFKLQEMVCLGKLKNKSLKLMVITFCKERPSCDRVIRRAFCNLRNEIKICNLRNGNMLMICKIEICNLQFLFCKSLAYFHFANYRFSFRFPN